MALSGDLREENGDKRASIRFENQIFFTDEGLVEEFVENSKLHCLSNLIEVIEGDIEAVLPLIGYPKHNIKSLLENNVLSATHEVFESLEKLGQRPLYSDILVHKKRLYGVVIDRNNKCQVVGRITSVIPKRETNDGLNVLIVEEEGNQITCLSKDLNLRDLVKNGAVFCMSSNNGFAFIESNKRTTEDFLELTLVVNRGYILFKEISIDWIRLQTGLRIDEFAVKTTRISPKECFICLRSGFIREDNRFVVYGHQSGVLDFEAFLMFCKDLQTIGFETGQHITADDVKEFSGVSERSLFTEMKEMKDSVTELQENQSNSESKESFDSEYDNISPDSFP